MASITEHRSPYNTIGKRGVNCEKWLPGDSDDMGKVAEKKRSLCGWCADSLHSQCNIEVRVERRMRKVFTRSTGRVRVPATKTSRMS